MVKQSACRSFLTAGVLTITLLGCAQSQNQLTHNPSAITFTADSRLLVKLPEEMRLHTLANMRDHLQALRQIQEALAREQCDRAGSIAEQQLGMTSLKLHGAHEVAKYMPVGMQAIGTEMHHAASRFALAAKDVGASGDVKPALAALANISAHCVACHPGYRIQ